MSRIGVYSVDPAELSKPPSKRQYEERGMYDVTNHMWTDSTDSRIPCILPDEENQEYDIEDIQDAIESATLHVYLASEVPGKVIPSSASRYQSRSASD